MAQIDVTGSGRAAVRRHASCGPMLVAAASSFDKSSTVRFFLPLSWITPLLPLPLLFTSIVAVRPLLPPSPMGMAIVPPPSMCNWMIGVVAPLAKLSRPVPAARASVIV